MGLSYLSGKSWCEISREERYFCAYLFGLINHYGVNKFVGIINLNNNNNINPLLLDTNWEIGYEVCFYRDYIHKIDNNLQIELDRALLKRTFDFCLMSDYAIIVIEAKAHENFESKQLNSLSNDRNLLSKLTNISEDKIYFLSLTSESYKMSYPTKNIFDGFLTWKFLANFYGLKTPDPILQRADELYSTKVSSGNNAECSMLGIDLKEEHDNGKNFLVGRGGGINGRHLEEDIKNERWKTNKYEVNKTLDKKPNSNWFYLSEFMEKIYNSQVVKDPN